MALFVEEKSPKRLILRGRPTLVWGFGLFFVFLGLFGLFFGVNEASLACERDEEIIQCVSVPRSGIHLLAERIEFDYEEWRDVRMEKTNQTVDLVLVDETYPLFRYRSSDDPRLIKQRVDALESFFGDSSEESLELILGNHKSNSRNFGAIALLGILIMLFGPLRRISFDSQTSQLNIRQRTLFFVKEKEWPLSDIKGAHLKAMTHDHKIRYTLYLVELQTYSEDNIQISTGGPLPQKRDKICDEINQFLQELHNLPRDQ